MPTNTLLCFRSHMKDHLELLQKISEDGPIRHNSELSDFDVQIVQELFEQGLIEATEHAPLSGNRQYLNIRINMLGRKWIEARTSLKSITVSQASEHIVDVKPNFFGVGLNLNAAWRKFRQKT